MDEQKRVTLAAVGFIVVVAAVIAVYFFVLRGRGEKEAEEPEPAEEVLALEETPVLEPEEPEFTQVALDESDDLIRRLAGALSSFPSLEEWLKTEDIVRHFVAAMDDIARGQSPRANIEFFVPDEKFSVLETDGSIIVDPKSYERYTQVAEAFASLETAETVRLYRQLRPVLQEAYTELGYPEKDFHPQFIRAIRELLAVPRIEGDIALVDNVGSFSFADPSLEELSPAQKHLLRMGPENLARVQGKLRALLESLGE